MKQLGIRGRLGLTFVLLSTLPALLLGLYRLDLFIRTLESLALVHVENNIALLRERLDSFLFLAERDLYSLRESFFFESYLRSLARKEAGPEREAVVRMFLGYLRDKPAYYRLRFLDGYGSERIKIRMEAGAGYREAPRAELEDGVGTYYLYRAQEQPQSGLLCFPGEILAEPDERQVVQVVTLVLPVLEKRGALEGLLILEILAEEYFEILERSGLPSLGIVAVADREGHYLYHSEYRRDWNLLLASRTLQNVQEHFPDPVASQILSGQAGRISGMGEQIISFVPLRVGSDTPYVLFYAVPQDVVFASIRSFRRLFAGLLLVTGVVAALLALVAAKRFTDPIRTLRSGAAVLASGDLTHRIRLRTGDEVEELAGGFNAMAEALQEREVKLQALRDYQQDIVKSLNDGILVFDRDLLVRVANPALARMTGIKGDAAVGRSFDAVFPVPKARHLKTVLERALSGEVLESEALLPGAREDLVTAELSFPMQNERGETTGVILRATDITAHRAAERALLEAKSTLQTIFDGIKAGIRLVSADHRVIAANQFHEKLFGKSAAEILGDHCYAAFPGAETVCRDCPGNKAMKTGRPDEAEFERRLEDGRPIVLQVDAYPVFADGGRPSGFIEFIQDISEKRGLERELARHATELEQRVAERTQALRVSEERYRDLVENSPEMIHLLSPDGRLLHANKTEREKLGYSLDELSGMLLSELVLPQERPKLSRHQKEVASRGRSRMETVFLPRTGEPIEVEMDATGQFDERGRLTQIRAFVRDITERKRIEERLFQTEKMVAVGQLASGLAHEIGTPLNTISGMAEFLLMTGGDNGASREELEAIVVQAKRISHLVQQLLDFSRPTRARRTMVDPHEVLELTLHLLERSLTASGIEIQLELLADPVRLRADPNHLQQVFTNIILNAQQAMPGGGSLRIETRRASLGRVRQLEMRFEDTGPGIPAENRKRIFEPFFTTKEVGKGTGLGLAICYSIVRQHGGSIGAENVPGSGARFLLSFPLLKREV